MYTWVGFVIWWSSPWDLAGSMYDGSSWWVWLLWMSFSIVLVRSGMLELLLHSLCDISLGTDDFNILWPWSSFFLQYFRFGDWLATVFPIAFETFCDILQLSHFTFLSSARLCHFHFTSLPCSGRGCLGLKGLALGPPSNSPYVGVFLILVLLSFAPRFRHLRMTTWGFSKIRWRG